MTALPDFCRRQWVSAAARELWEPRIAKIGVYWAAAERASVVQGFRSATLQNITPEGLPALSRMAAERGFVVTVLDVQGQAARYSAQTQPATPGDPWDYRVALSTHGVAATFENAWGAGDDEAIGTLLGFPKCCREFFADTWAKGVVDPTPAMRTIDGPPVANSLLRWLGVRFVPHLPCSGDCRATIDFGSELRSLFPEDNVLSWADELLDMPMRYTSLNGVGELVTPLVTLNFKSDPEHEDVERERPGESYPLHSATGLRFPYRPPSAADKAIDPRLWTDNGFDSADAMSLAHAVVVGAANHALGELGEPGERRFGRFVVDLGSGNGVLARRLAGTNGHAVGVELDPDKADRSIANLDGVTNSNLHDVDPGTWGDADLFVLMPGRLIENGGNPKLVARLKDHGAPLIVYAYGDWIAEHRTLGELCKAAGLPGELAHTVESTKSGAAAGVWKWTR